MVNILNFLSIKNAGGERVAQYYERSDKFIHAGFSGKINDSNVRKNEELLWQSLNR